MSKAFTLVEVLVVCAIIGLLAAIAIPTLRVQNARAKSASCLANLRTIGVGLQLYLAEHNGMFPEFAAARPDREEEVPVIDTGLLAYVEDAGVFRCPADSLLYEKTGTSYYWNSALNGQAVGGLNLFGLISDLSRIPILVDKDGWHHYTENRVNHLFADGHASATLRLFAE